MLGLVSSAFPWLRSGDTEESTLIDWGTDPYALGTYSYPGVNAVGRPREWRACVNGTLFFAGEATCGYRHPATVQGAFESGLQSAQAVGAAFLDHSSAENQEIC
jgi:monoamine oxidase